MSAEDQVRETRLLALAREMVTQLRGAPGPAPDLGSSLERDLGLDSLSRMELFHRAEREFGAALDERTMVEIETLGDLAAALSGGPERAAGAPLRSAETYATAGSDERAPAIRARTLVEALAWHAQRHPARVHVRFYADADDPGGDGETLSYGELWEEAGHIAAGLVARDISPGETILIMLPTGRDYLVAFFAILRAGCVPVPVYPPGRIKEIEDHIRRHAKIAQNARARLMITIPEAVQFSRLLAAQVDTLAGIVTMSDLAGAPRPNVWPDAKPDDVAFIQYTSGSTGDPKGVVLSHANLIANINAMAQALGVRDDDVFVSWLPLYHDMGLIGAWLGSMVHGIPLILMSPLSFLARPRRWLDAISRHRGTISGAPNFAYENCAHRLDKQDIDGLDLSSWRVAFNGAEPVSPATIAAFTERFAGVGFNADAMKPVYGLAENSVGLAFTPVGRGPRIDWIERDVFLKTGEARPISHDAPDAKAIVCCGLPIPGHEIRVVGEDGIELADRREGTIQFKGPSATRGYLRNDAANADLIAGEWRNSGDLGYMVAGEIHVTGRRKDMVIRAGRNIFPAELETAIGTLDGISQGAVAVFGSPDPTNGTERLVVMAESRRAGTEAEEKLRRAITDLALDLIGIAPDAVRLVPPRTVPKTSSGKIRRQAARAVFESGRTGAFAARWQIARLAIAAALPFARKSIRRGAYAVHAAYATAFGLVICAIGWVGVAIVPVTAWRFAFLRALIAVYLPLVGIRLTVRGRENVPRGARAVLFAANHASYLDGPILLAALPGTPAFVAKSELLGHWVSRIFLKRLGTLFIERFDAARGVAETERMAETARGGRSVVSFPEGTLSRMSGLAPFQLGTFMAAVRANAPIVPVAVRGTRQIMRDGNWVPRPGRIEVELLAPILPSGEREEWSDAIELRDRVRAAILAACGEPDLAHERPLDKLSADARGIPST